VIDAADAALLVAAEPEIGAAVRTILIDDADHAARVANAKHFLAQHTIFFGGPSASGNSSTAAPAARTGAAIRPSASRPAFGQEFVVLGAEHGVTSGIV
jgi:hypothetical protein